jgi:hypothetical protein
LIARTIVINMCLRYMEGICPYDVTQDGQVSILDITHCAQNGIPENIIQDIVHNVGAEVPMPVIPEPTPPPVEPGPWIHTMNLWMPEGNYMLLRGTPYYGPVHKHHNNVGSLYMTEYTHKNHSVLLIPAVENPAEALAELPSGNLMPLPESIPENTTPVIPPMDFGNFNMDFSNLDFSNFGFGNNTQTQEDSNQTGGAPSNDNNQQNNNSGGNSGGGGGAY